MVTRLATGKVSYEILERERDKKKKRGSRQEKL